VPWGKRLLGVISYPEGKLGEAIEHVRRGGETVW
jgi:hypothetical protein